MRIQSLFAGLPLLATLALSACGKADATPPPATPTTSATPDTAAAAPVANGAAPAAPAVASAPAAPATPATPVAAVPTPATPPATAGEITVGQAPPDFTANDQDGKPVHLAELKGKPVVVYFYPKDETPGCTKEACSFRDAWSDLSKKGVVIIGISTDTEKSHKEFATHHKLPFVLVSDPKGEIAAKFGVPVEGGYTKRESFVVGVDGNVKKIYRKVDVTHHAAEIAADVK
jgi:peroxiredoxin Q/BCP